LFLLVVPAQPLQPLAIALADICFLSAAGRGSNARREKKWLFVCVSLMLCAFLLRLFSSSQQELHRGFSAPMLVFF